MKLLSVVIANYNYGRFLEQAICSVLAANDKRIELVLVDGGSTDESLDIIEKYASRIDWWCSERDEGQSDAFNKGFAHATGKYLTWLNADDLFVPGALKKVLHELEEHPECEWFTSNTYRFTSDSKIANIWWGPHALPGFLQTKGMALAVYGPSSFFAKNAYERVGRIRKDMNFMMDIDLWAKFVLSGIKQRRINVFCWAFRLHKDSKTAEYGIHRLSSERRSEFEKERWEFYKRTGYKEDWLTKKMGLLWRLVDFSLIRLLWYKLIFRRIPKWQMM